MTKLAYNPDIWVEGAEEIPAGIKPCKASPKPRVFADRDVVQSLKSKTRLPLSRSTANQTETGLLAALLDERCTEATIPGCFPDVVIKIHDAFDGPGRSAEEFVKLVEGEPRLAALLLQLANAASFGTGVDRHLEPRGAIARLGRPLIQSTAVMFAVRQMKDQLRLRSIAAPLSELWRESLAVACIGQVIARRVSIGPETAFLAGLLHGIGYLYIAARAVGKTAALGHDLVNNPSIAKRHPAIGGAALLDWHAGQEVAEAVRDQNDYSRAVRGRSSADLTDILVASTTLTRALGQLEPRVVATEVIGSFATLSLSTEDCLQTLRHAEYRLASLWDDFA